MSAMLQCSGEVGYAQVSVRSVCERYGGSSDQFYREFEDKAECFAAAYDREAERICEQLLSLFDSGGNCTERFEVALGYLTEVAAAEPAVARAIFLEVHVAGGTALEKRREVVERLSRAVDSACRETSSRQNPPPVTAEFIVGIVEQAISGALVRRDQEELHEAVPELAVVLGNIYWQGRGGT